MREEFQEFFLFTFISEKLHGFVAWFDVEFEGTQEKIVLSTSPENEETHWVQTLFYLNNPIQLEMDDIIAGKLDVVEAKENKRFLDVHFNVDVKNNVFDKVYKLRYILLYIYLD